jgi:hypothetical protein
VIEAIAGCEDQTLISAMASAASGAMQSDTGLSESIQSLIYVNSALWELEDRVRQLRWDYWQATRLKRRIDTFNARRQEIVNLLDSEVRKMCPKATSDDAALLHESPGEILDRMTIETVRLTKLRLLSGYEMGQESEEIKSTRKELIALKSRLVEVFSLISTGAYQIRPYPRKKTFLTHSYSNIKMPNLQRSVERDFASLDTRVAMDLHREFQQDMRTLRDEEFKLSDVYMKVVAFSGGAVAVLLSRAKYSADVGYFAAAIVGLYWVFLGALVLRIRANHNLYAKLGGWVMKIRVGHAGGAFFHHEVDQFGKGSGFKKQIISLLLLAISVSAVIGGALYLNFEGKIGSGDHKIVKESPALHIPQKASFTGSSPSGYRNYVPIVPDGLRHARSRVLTAQLSWWPGPGSNRRPSAFQADAHTN